MHQLQSKHKKNSKFSIFATLYFILPEKIFAPMSEKRKTYEGGLFFVSFSVVSFIDLFVRDCYHQILVDSIKYCQDKKGLLLYEYVIMPSHLHWLASAENGKLSEILRDYKSFTSKRLITEIIDNNQESRKNWLLHIMKYHGNRLPQKQNYQLWKHDNHPIDILNEPMLRQKINYIHNNPVVSGFVNSPEDWRLSSASKYSPVKCIEV